MRRPILSFDRKQHDHSNNNSNDNNNNNLNVLKELNPHEVE